MIKQDEIAYHEAGHVLIIYILYGNLNFIEHAEIDRVEDDAIDFSCFGGITRYTLKDLKHLPLPSIMDKLPEIQKYGIDFIIACILYSGGIAEKLMSKQDCLNFRSMRKDIEEFDKICVHEEKEKIISLAMSFCEKELDKRRKYLLGIAEGLKKVIRCYSLKLVFREELEQIIEKYGKLK